MEPAVALGLRRGIAPLKPLTGLSIYQTKELEASDGEAALAVLEENGTPSLLFTDVVLPGGMSGTELTREVSVRAPAVKVLYTTGYGTSVIEDHGKLDDVIDLIRKPLEMSDLAHKVRHILDYG